MTYLKIRPKGRERKRLRKLTHNSRNCKSINAQIDADIAKKCIISGRIVDVTGVLEVVFKENGSAKRENDTKICE